MLLQPRVSAHRTKMRTATRTGNNMMSTASGLNLAALKLNFLQRIAGLDRGKIMSESQRLEAQQAIIELERQSRVMQADNLQVTSHLNGKWQLIFTDTNPVFTSSPFFWAFATGLVGEQAVADAIFAFTDAIPGATVGQAYQTLDLEAGTLVSEVDLEVFPGARGCVVTSCSVATGLPPAQLLVTVENTKVARSNLLAFVLDQVVVPVKELMEGVRGPGATQVTAQITYLDEELRVTRVQPSNQAFVYRKLY
ncbi:hypothetical protein QJQ45_009750 [Haematococcus lacustris]|nr:hypothetical protein QJQ45_009750 [Haematococcus lacustris]